MASQEHTFLFADLAGFTALTEVHGDEVAADAVGRFVDAVRGMLEPFEAEEVKTIGDAVMLRTARATAGVRLAIEIVKELGRRQGALAVRAGVHTGTAVHRDGDWFGAGVNLCARVAAMAERGEVLMTAATKQALGHELDGLQLQYRGFKRLKNVSQRVEVYALTLAPTAADGVVIDPVCWISVDPEQSTERRIFRGVEYHFCSSSCAALFEARPARYAGQQGRSLELRVSDNARERVVARLERAYGKGRIDELELERRVGRAMHAQTRGELQAVTHDLPRRRRRVNPWLAPIYPLIVFSRVMRARLRRVRRRWRGR